MTVKKNAEPILYPVDKDLKKQWFIQYPNPNGGKPLKKYGQLNKLKTLSERMSEAEKLIIICYKEMSVSTIQNSLLIRSLNDVVNSRMQGKKDKTKYGYTSKLKVFSEWYRLSAKCTLSEKTGIEFLSWLRVEKKLSNISINGYRRHLKSFFSELLTSGMILSNPFDKTKKLQEKTSTKTWFRIETQNKLMKLIEPIEPQLWLACMTQYYCFIRPGDELMGLTILDIIDRDTPQWKFRISEMNAKTGKFRFVPIAPALKIKLEEYIEGYPDHFYIFGKGGKPSTEKIGRNTLYNKHRLFLESIDMPKGNTFYSWKNTGAVMMYKNGVKMKYISLLMGHSSIEITDIYFKSLGIDDVMNEINISYPTIGF